MTTPRGHSVRFIIVFVHTTKHTTLNCHARADGLSPAHGSRRRDESGAQVREREGRSDASGGRVDRYDHEDGRTEGECEQVVSFGPSRANESALAGDIRAGGRDGRISKTLGSSRIRGGKIATRS